MMLVCVPLVLMTQERQEELRLQQLAARRLLQRCAAAPVPVLIAALVSSALAVVLGASAQGVRALVLVLLTLMPWVA